MKSKKINIDFQTESLYREYSIKKKTKKAISKLLIKKRKYLDIKKAYSLNKELPKAGILIFGCHILMSVFTISIQKGNIYINAKLRKANIGNNLLLKIRNRLIIFSDKCQLI